MKILLRRLFGPIRNCIQIENSNSFICAVETPGFTKELLKTQITHNDLFLIDGDTSIMDGIQLIRRCRIHEAIQLPHKVQIETIEWTTENGITIMRCKSSN